MSRVTERLPQPRWGASGLRRDGYPVDDADVQRLSPLVHDHSNLLDRYHFTNPDNPADALRPLRDPRTADDD